MCANRPPPAVLSAFGVDGEVRPLTGGQGTSWASDALVLKRDDGPVYEWLAPVLAGVVAEGVRVASPVRTRAGAWTHEGWSATRRIEGEDPHWSDASTCIAIIEAGRAFHRAVAHVPRPECLDARTDPWARADRAAWGERGLPLRPELAPLVSRLQDAMGPLGRPQIVHGDLTGNVLFASGLEPGIIDVSPYWRPPAYAEGVVVADALCWHSAPAAVLDRAGVPVAAVARGLLFRMATTNELACVGGTRVDLATEARRYAAAISAIGL